MVAKKSRITAKPQPKPEDVEALLNELGTDPEATVKPPEGPTPTPTPEPAPDDSKGKKKAFPHRLSADFDAAQYKRLKRAAFETEIPLTSSPT